LTFQQKISIPLTHALGNVQANFDFSMLLLSSYEPIQDRQTDGQDAKCGLQDGCVITTLLPD